jgi:hypothetical protein
MIVCVRHVVFVYRCHDFLLMPFLNEFESYCGMT